MKNNLRAFFRVSTRVPFIAKPMPGTGPEQCSCRLTEQGFDESMKKIMSRKINLSGAGIAFESDVPYTPGDLLEVRLMLDDVYLGIIELCVEVLRCDIKPKHFIIAVRYMNMNEQIMELIAQFVYEREKDYARHKRLLKA